VILWRITVWNQSQLGLAALGEGFFIGGLPPVVARDAVTTTTGLALGICLPYIG